MTRRAFVVLAAFLTVTLGVVGVGIATTDEADDAVGAVAVSSRQRSTTLRWVTARSTTARVDIRNASGDERVVRPPRASTQHVVTIDDLECGREYQYRVAVTGEAGTRVGRDSVLRTAPCEGSELDVEQVVIDDDPACHVLERAAADISGDGRIDAVVGWGDACSNGGVWWYEQPRAGVASGEWSKHPIIRSGHAYEDIATVDFDRDGAVDVVAAIDDEIRWFRNPQRDRGDWRDQEWDSTRVGTVRNDEDAPLGPESHDFVVVDVDGDGAVDVVTNTWIFFATGDGWTKVPYNRRGEGVATLDIGDGFVHLVGMSRDAPYRIVWMENPRARGGDARPDVWTAHTVGPAYDDIPTGLAFASADLNGDGRVDVVSAQAERKQPENVASPGGLVWWEAPADPRAGTWKKHVIDATFRDIHKVNVSDFDRNGAPDLSVAEQEQAPRDRVAVLLNDGRGSFRPVLLSTESGHNQTLGDFDGDGTLDVFSSAHGYYGAPVRIEIFLVAPTG